MDYNREYRKLLRTAEEAVGLIEQGEDIITGMAAGEPPALLNALAEHPGLLGNRLYINLPTHRPPVEVDKERLEITSTYLSAADRDYFAEERIDLIPNHFSQLPRLLLEITSNRVIMAVVSPMDSEGYFSLGTNCDYTAPLVEHAKTILLEVNENMPRTFGKNRIHISKAKEKEMALVENHEPIPELLAPAPKEPDEKIAHIVAAMINDGDTLQLGVGSIPGLVIDSLKDHEDLGIFTEALPEGIIDLYEAGAISNRNKPFYEGKSTTTFAFGSRRLYDFIHENPDIYMLPVDEANNVCAIGQIDNVISVNASVEVDFLGQCASEMVAGRYYSSTGGQSDFSRGVRLSKHGRGIVIVRSTAKNGTISRIVPTLRPGTAVSTHKNDVDTVVTEYGAATLKGKTIRQRTHALIGIAHPRFRDELKFKAKEMGYW